VLGRRKKSRGRWDTEQPATCLLGDNHAAWYERCPQDPITIGRTIIPACRAHLADWAALVGLDWAARVGVIPYAADWHGTEVALCYPCNPLPSRAPRPGSNCEAGSVVDVSPEEFEALTDALLELGAPVARLFSLQVLRTRAVGEQIQALEDEWRRVRFELHGYTSRDAAQNQ
jgi:hypothetical protein